ncbi:NAD-dependent epimerase/dehydratase family protein [Perlabentimonas gracilis]|uniref:NAD-dependent epimerase/dehydratase family protein n=1 Tax=Perlabentimonas gracilis TaxID=2715279 RepID=UPI0014093ECD|nr:NAD-dependent epimerase/dehydratase family protein [Perlabentimonas gracilis]NHB69853.1 NAD-dependent epimerase/dehydratase family protein [Perlabentimonas gracilis]
MKDETKILLTGSSGFIATNLYNTFHKDFNLLGLDITTKGEFPASTVYSWKQLDQLPHVTTIIHLAGKAHDTKNTSDPQSYFHINLGLTQKIFDFFLESDAEKFIFFSTVKAVADSVEGEYLTEDIEPNPQTPYGQSKQEAEKYILSKKLPAGKKVYILRPCMIHGPGNKGNLNLLYSIVKKGIPWPLGAFENKRSFLSIDNLSFVIRQLIEKDIEPGAYQVADDEPLSTNQLFSIIAESLGKKPRVYNISRGLIKCLAKTGDLLHLPLNTERLKKLTESYVVSNSKLKAALGIDRMPVSARDGLVRTLESFKGTER